MTRKRGSRPSRKNIPLSRSEVMSRVKHKDTRPEWRVRRAFWTAGLRYRLHVKDLPGRPDLVFPSRKVVLFVHGCFWHAHEGCPRHRIPKSRSEWWTDKILGNKARDARTKEALEALGWMVLVIWECESEAPERVAHYVDLVRSISSRSGAAGPRGRLDDVAAPR